MSKKLTLKVAEGCIKSQKVIVALEYRYESCSRWWISSSSIGQETKFYFTYLLANRYFTKLAKKWGLNVKWNYDEEGK